MKEKLKKCLIEVELYVKDDGAIDVNRNIDLLNDIGKYFEPKQIKHIGVCGIKEKTFYKMLAEIHERVADESCGCMGSNYTPERVEKQDKNKTEYSNKRDRKGRYIYKCIPSKTPLDYLGNIIRKYIKIEK